MARASPFVFKTLQQRSTPKSNTMKILRKNHQGGGYPYCDDDPVAGVSVTPTPLTSVSVTVRLS